MYYLLGCFGNSSELKIKSIWQYTVDIKLRVLRSSTSYKGKKTVYHLLRGTVYV